MYSNSIYIKGSLVRNASSWSSETQRASGDFILIWLSSSRYVLELSRTCCILFIWRKLPEFPFNNEWGGDDCDVAEPRMCDLQQSDGNFANISFFSILFALEIFMSRGLTNYGPRRRALPINNSINILCSSRGENLRTHKKLCYDYVGEREISLAERLGVPSTPSFENRLATF